MGSVDRERRIAELEERVEKLEAIVADYEERFARIREWIEDENRSLRTERKFR